jgi:hypothetical protein
MWDVVRGSASDACLPLPKPEKLHLEPLLLPRHDCLPTAIQIHNHILELTQHNRKTSAISTQLSPPPSNRPYPTRIARRIASTARDHNERL